MPPTRTRLDWVDSAKGLAIVLVAVFHAGLVADAAGGLEGPWSPLNEALRWFRMPLFFLVSGFLAASSLRRPWRELWRGKFSVWLWLYVLWSGIALAALVLVDSPRGGLDATWRDAADVVLWPERGLWYLYALALFLAAARLTRRVPAPVVVLVAAVVSSLWTEQLLLTGNFAWDYMGRNLVFFVVGVRAPQLVSALVDAVRRPSVLRTAAVVVVALVAAGAAAHVAGLPVRSVLDVPEARLLVAVTMCATGVAFSVLVASTVLGRALAAVGRRTLPIYLGHEILMGLVAFGVVRLVPLDAGWLPFVLTPALAAAGIGCAVLLNRVAGRVPGLYAPPRWFTGRIRRRADGSSRAQPTAAVGLRGSGSAVVSPSRARPVRQPRTAGQRQGRH